MTTRKSNHVFVLLFLFASIMLTPLFSESAEIIGPETTVINNEIFVTTGVILDEIHVEDLKNGISKEITFYIDLFRVWSIWPNEFILGKVIVKTLKSDPIKKEYVASSFDGMVITERRFNNFNSMLKWALSVNKIKLTNIKELDQDEYFIKITVESKLRRLPLVLSYLFFFVPEKEFKVTKDSQKIQLRITK
ncbi:MAG: DUF4390 domain-containing protein [Nitrospiraceae bacterium]|nr:DUF4390 domain-containing protein [Nitrospiraceae bacterium]